LTLGLKKKKKKKKKRPARHWWLTPVILATLGQEDGGSKPAPARELISKISSTKKD
jgi:hypothetical protein